MSAIADWLDGLGLKQYAKVFIDNDIDIDVLPELTDEHLKELGISLGHRLKLLRAIAMLSSPQPQDLPPPEASAASAPLATSAAERRQLTVMFCDLVDSTALSERFDPEDLSRIIRAYQDCCAAVISRYEGHIARYMGDGILAYFGYPRAHEDDAERALRTGLDMINAVGQLQPQPDLALQIRIGVATGLVVVGERIGDASSQEQVVVGETPNLAARLQGLAQPNSLVIAASTRQLAGELFNYADLGCHELKGFSEPMRTWQVTAVRAAESRFEATHSAGLMPLVGRDEELELLIKRWDWAKEGEGQVVLLSGEPGIGKSRLVRALREQLADESCTLLSHYCSPYHQNTALHPLIGLIERAARFARDDAPEDKLRKLAALLVSASHNIEETVPLLAALLAIPTGDRYESLALTPQRQKQRTLEVLLSQMEGLAGIHPVLAVYEDVQWIDPTTLELLGLLIERVQGLPILVVITYRPEFNPSWTGQAHVTQLSLTRLTRRYGEAIAERIANGKALPAEVFEQIVAKTDGIPLFVEELTKAVLESGLLKEAGDHYELSGPLPPLAIPTSLHDSLMARLDRLAPVKEIAQIGAALGREFSYELLAAVAPLAEEQLQDALDQLMRSELLFHRGAAPEVRYRFKHALVQDVAYQSMLKATRYQLHGRIAQILCERADKEVETPPELIAEHFTRAEMHQKAMHYWLKAGEQAKAAYANREAISHLENCVSIASLSIDVSAKPSTDIERLYLTALALLGDLAGLADDLHEANHRYDQALTRCRNEKLRTWISNKRHHPATTYRDGAKLAFYTHGSGRETLLLVNPLIYGLAVFQPLLEQLCQDFCVVTVDCRGAGNSDALTRPFPLSEHAKDVAAVIEALDSGSVIGVGISRGANILIMLAVSHPQLINKLVTVGCPPVDPGSSSAPTHSLEYIRQRTEAFKKGDIETLLRIQSAFVFPEPGTDELKRLVVGWGTQLPADTVLSFYDPDPSMDITLLLEQVAIPTLVLHGVADKLVPFATAEYLARKLPNAQLYGFNDKGHLPMFTATDEFCNVLRHFVRIGTLP